MSTLAEARTRVLRRLNDEAERFFTASEVEDRLRHGYRLLCHQTRCIWDQVYLENLPRGFSYTAEFERTMTPFDYGRANYTAEFERRLFDPETDAEGPGNHTYPAEATEGHLSDAGANTAIPATASLPAGTVAIDRPTWDDATIALMTPSQAERGDSRYELTEGEVYGLVAKKDGVQTVRKVRVPSAQADTFTINGSWGLMRRCTDISGATVSGTWGFPRRIPTMHPMGPEHFGAPRRPYRDGSNVRVEHWREGQAVTAADDAFEVPDRAVRYLEDYAMSEVLAREGPAQDTALAAHYASRWERGVARLRRRVESQQRERVGQFGGPVLTRRGPPRPSLPWQFGVVVR